MNKLLIAMFCMILIVSLPVVSAQLNADVLGIGGTQQRAEQIGNQFSDITDNVPQSLQGEPEDIAISVSYYEPQIIKSALLEQNNIYVNALLEGKSFNPSISVPRISRVTIREVKVTTSPPGMEVSVKGIRHIKPKDAELSFNNLGYLQIPISRIPQEAKVPDAIDIQIDAQVDFDVSSGLTFGPFTDVLREQKIEQWQSESSSHSFYAGYVRATEVLDNQATFTIYDNNFDAIREGITLRPGATSGAISSYGSFTGLSSRSVFDSFRVRLDQIRDRTSTVDIVTTREDGDVYSKNVGEGQDIYDGSEWVVNKITFVPISSGSENVEVELRNKRTREGTKLLLKREFSTEETGVKLEELLSMKVTIADTRKFLEANERYYPYIVGDRRAVSTYLSLLTEVSSGPLGPTLPPAYLAPQAIQDMLAYVQDSKDTTINVTKNVTIVNGRILLVTSITNPPTSITRPEDITEFWAIKKGLNPDRSVSFSLVKDDSFRYSTPTTPAASTPVISTDRPFNDAVKAYKDLIEAYPEEILDESMAIDLPGIKSWEMKGMPYKVIGRMRLGELYESKSMKAEARGIYQELLSINYDNNVNIFAESRLKELKTKEKYDARPIDMMDGSYRISVVMTDVSKAIESDKASAILTVGDKVQQTYYLGNLITAGDASWEIKQINDQNVVLEAIPRFVGGSVLTPTPARVVLARNKLSADLFDSKGVPTRVVLHKTNLNREAVITIIPDTERAHSKAVINLHLPIEKRALDVPLFSSTIEEEISKVEDLIAELDEILDAVRQVHSYFQNFCFIMYGVLFSKNFLGGLFGSGDNMARKHVNEKWKEDWQQAKAEGNFTGDFDKYVFSKQGAYESDLEEASRIVEDIKNGRHLDGFSGYEDDDKDVLADLYFKKNAAFQPDSSDADKRAYIAARYEMEDRLAYNDFVKNIGDKDWDKIDAGYRRQMIDTLKTTPEYRSKEDKDFAEMFSKSDDKREMLEAYKNTKLLSRYSAENDRLTKTFADTASAYYTETVIPSTVVSSPVTSTTNFGTNPGGESTYTNKEVGVDGLSVFVDDGGTKRRAKPVDLEPGTREWISDSDPTAAGSFNFVISGKDGRTLKHQPRVVLYTADDDKKNAGRVKYITLDAYRYIQAEYNAAGAVTAFKVFERFDANEVPGRKGDHLEEDLSRAITNAQREGKAEEVAQLKKAQRCISSLNKQLLGKKVARGSTIKSAIECGADSAYLVSDSIPANAGPACVDYMTPTDCGLLFNACDPVICPSSRCNLGGRYTVPNVVQSGIIGSVALCLDNFGTPPDGVLVPVCITGILAGLENLRTILQSYGQCLQTAVTNGESVGLCDRLRSFYVCDVLWKEAGLILGIQNGEVKEGLLKKIANIFEGDQGGEYSNFDNAVENSIGSVEYFTQSYAKNVFAAFNAGSIGELGAEVCKTAIFGKVPGAGNFYDQISRPESPPQFTAFFDENSYTTLDPSGAKSDYQVFWHMFAGSNFGRTGRGVTFSVYMQRSDEGSVGIDGMPVRLQPIFLVRNQRVEPGKFLSSKETHYILPKGYNQICVEYSSEIYGGDRVCGFGKVSTSFGVNYLTDQFVKDEVARRGIDSEKECVGTASTGTVTSGGGPLLLGGLTIGAFSTGLLQAGLARVCGTNNPGVGFDSNNWIVVGKCGLDDRGRDLGACWLYKPTIADAFSRGNIGDRTDAIAAVANLTAELTKTEGLLVGETEAKAKFTEAKALISGGKFEDAVKIYDSLSTSLVLGSRDLAKAMFMKAEALKRMIGTVVPTPIIQQQPATPPQNVPQPVQQPQPVEPQPAQTSLNTVKVYAMRGWQPADTLVFKENDTIMLTLINGNKEASFKFSIDQILDQTWFTATLHGVDDDETDEVKIVDITKDGTITDNANGQSLFYRFNNPTLGVYQVLRIQGYRLTANPEDLLIRFQW